MEYKIKMQNDVKTSNQIILLRKFVRNGVVLVWSDGSSRGSSDMHTYSKLTFFFSFSVD